MMRMCSRICSASLKMLVVVGAGMYPLASAFAAPSNVTFAQAAPSVAAYDFVEVAVNVANPDARNPFMDVSVMGSFEIANTGRHWQVDGFCDSPDGSVYRIRFMPPTAGDYKYTISYRQGAFQKNVCRNVSGDGQSSQRANPHRSAIPMAFHLGRHGRALFLQWHDRLLADRMEGRADHQVQHRSSSPA